MNRTSRLFKLMDALRGHRRSVTAASLAQELGVSVRTIYRDVQTLVELGAPIEGEAGIGFVLRPGYFLPPLMFDEDELEALVLGARWFASRETRRSGEPPLRRSRRSRRPPRAICGIGWPIPACGRRRSQAGPIRASR